MVKARFRRTSGAKAPPLHFQNTGTTKKAQFGKPSVRRMRQWPKRDGRAFGAEVEGKPGPRGLPANSRLFGSGL